MPADILLLACYELGHAPLSLAWPLAFLQAAELKAEAVDLSVQPLLDEQIASAKIIAIAAPMHTALRLGAAAAQRVRAQNPAAHICFFGLYAWLNADYLLSALADSVIAGEVEEPLRDLCAAVLAGQDFAAIPGVSTAQHRATPHLARLPFPVPQRASFPLENYARYVYAGETQLAGYVEASRGCLHTCRHCPITPVYGGRFFTVPQETVLADIRQQEAQGAGHITFGDPDFLNGPKHALALARALHAEFPRLSFDFTTKVEHILQHRTLFPEFAALGCTFVVSAIESVSDHVLAALKKGHTAAQIDIALGVLDAVGIELQPTLVAFTPWTTLEDYLAQIEFIHSRRLLNHVPPIQLAIRLLIPPHSPLLSAPDASAWLGDLDPAAFSYRWTHPDPRLDALHAQVSARVEQADEAGELAEVTHAAIRELAYAAAHRSAPLLPYRPARPAPPRLTENWFC
jgi:hypothetical protein